MIETTLRYSDEHLQEFKSIILKKMEQAQKDYNHYSESYKNDLNNGTDDTSPTFKSFDEGANISNKESSAETAARQEKLIRDLRLALIRIENKTYGMCRVTGKLISPDRLKLVPHATLSIEAKNMQE